MCFNHQVYSTDTSLAGVPKDNISWQSWHLE